MKGKREEMGRTEISTEIFFNASIIYFPSTLPLDPEKFFKGRLKKKNNTFYSIIQFLLNITSK